MKDKAVSEDNNDAATDATAATEEANATKKVAAEEIAKAMDIATKATMDADAAKEEAKKCAIGKQEAEKTIEALMDA